MDNMWMFYSSVIFLSVIQIQPVFVSGCNIVSVTSPSASTLNVVWSSYTGTSSYLLDLRVLNATNIAPVMAMFLPPNTQGLVQGLRPGHLYQVTLKVFVFYNTACTNVKTAMTVPATSQITSLTATSSTSIRFQWSAVTGADSYILFVEEQFTSPAKKYSQTFTTLGGQVSSLTPATVYNCYVYSSNSAGRGARSNIKTIMTMMQPPTGLTLVSTGKSTARVTWNIASKVLLYQVSVSDNNKPNNAPIIRNTSTTSMDISNLEPCSTYTVGVSSLSVYLMPGEPANVTYTTTSINPVTTISADYRCSTSMVTITWDVVLGATSYRATVVDDTGTSINCTSASNSCQITMLKCGMAYQVFVTAISQRCETTSNTSTLFETVPCAPANPQTFIDCTSNLITFSWLPTNNTFFYVAKAVDNTGKESTCMTIDGLCYFSDTECGQTYTYTVYAISDQCNSEVSQPVSVWTTPCLPTNLKTEFDCSSDELKTTWDYAAGALSYNVEAQGGTGETYNCTSASNSCAITSMPCGKYLTVWLIASNDKCSTDKMLADVVQTVPCTPTGVSGSVNCSQDSASVSWTASSGAIFYNVVVQDANGNSKICSSMGSSCLMKGLRCGQNYTTSVISTNLICNSTASEEATFKGAPCPPTNITAMYNCAPNPALVSWVASDSAKYYTVVAVSSRGHTSECTTNKTSCRLPGLHCGQVYTIGVSGADDRCTGQLSNTVSLVTEPCTPTNVLSQLICSAGTAQVSWAPSVNAVSYSVKATSNGQNHTCTSSSPNCTLSNLLCGQPYDIYVTATDGTCISNYSSPFRQNQVPCAPQNIRTNLLCGTNPLTVSWTTSAVPLNYRVTAVLLAGNNWPVTCHTNSTSCTLSGLQCGQTYNVSVKASSGNCTGPCSPVQTIQTAPCSPQSLTAVVDCSTNSVLVSWNTSPGSSIYTATVTGPNNFSGNCSTSNLTCSVSGLQCVTQYNVTLTSKDGQCTSSPSQTTVMTGPCPPQPIAVDLQCGSRTAVLSWEQRPNIEQYIATAIKASGGGMKKCNSTDFTCQFLYLDCGEVYNFTVIAKSQDCYSQASSAVSIQTEPCQAVIVSSQAFCLSEAVQISWQQPSGVSNYLVKVAGSLGYVKIYNTTQTLLSAALPCGQDFNVTVQGQGSKCDSNPSAPAFFTAMPCVPTNVSVVTDCTNNTAAVSWSPSRGAVQYSMIARNSHLNISCQTSSLSCSLDKLKCGSHYTIQVAAVDDNCSSIPSQALIFNSAPCQTQIIRSNLDCVTNSAWISWDATSGADIYTVTAVGGQGYNANCTTSNDTTCEVKDLACGVLYTFSVIAKNRWCESQPSATTELQTEPCPPSNVTVSTSCEDNSALVSWTPSPVAETYHVVATGVDERMYTCNTTFSNCTISKLPSDQQYRVSVTASNDNCSSKASQYVTANIGPCRPDILSVTFYCNNQSAMLSWTPTDNAVKYYGYVQAGNGDTLYCHSMIPTCTIKGLDCGAIYNFTVQSLNGIRNSSFSDPVQIEAAPCPPDALDVQLLQMQTETQVLRFNWTEVSCRDAEYILNIKGSLLGDGQALFELSSYWTNTEYFEIPLPCSSSYTATVKSRNTAGTSSPSVALNRITAPCPPSGVMYSFYGIVSWNASVFATTYTVYDNSVNPKAQLCNTAGLSCTLSNITSTYLVITASNSAGESEAQRVPNVVTHRRRRRDLREQMTESGLSAPVLDVKKTKSTVIFVQWSQVDAASQYSLMIRKQGSSDKPQELTVYGQNLLLSDLSPNSTYCFSVLVKNLSSSGPESESVCVQTGQGLPL